MCCSALLLALAVPAEAATGGAQPNGSGLAAAGVYSGGAAAKPIPAPAPGPTAVASVSGRVAAAPAGAPLAVEQAIARANAIVGRPYVWGGGHRSFHARGYDCSGAVSYLLHGGGLLASPLDSSSLMHWGAAGRGEWITVYTNPGHAFVEVAGLRLDTSVAGDPKGGRGPQWRTTLRSHAGFHARHPLGL